ncbi:hypothetical protein TNCV_3868531 [Trichonephila clavipes]|nr:hypothetical protein TNCV_3868531 [Trichonephila clavipes]
MYLGVQHGSSSRENRPRWQLYGEVRYQPLKGTTIRPTVAVSQWLFGLYLDMNSPHTAKPEYVQRCLISARSNSHAGGITLTVPLDWTDKGTQTRGPQVYRPFKCSFQRTVVAGIILKMAAATIDVTLVELEQ